MEYLKVKNWQDFQQYRDREPKWIKVYRSLLTDYKFCQLTDEEFGQLVKIWLLASQVDNNIPNDPSWIQQRTFMKKKPNLTKMLQLEFLQINAVVQNCTEKYLETETETETETEKKTYGEFKNILLTDEELQKLKDRFTDSGAQERIESISSYVASKKKKYASHYATILTWERKRQEEGKSDDWKRRFLQSD